MPARRRACARRLQRPDCRASRPCSMGKDSRCGNARPLTRRKADTQASPMPPLFLPTARQTNLLLLVGFLSFGYALYLRYLVIEQSTVGLACEAGDRKSTRLNSSHANISYAVFCLKKKKKK